MQGLAHCEALDDLGAGSWANNALTVEPLGRRTANKVDT